jgi:nicotinate-nucleotide adenylyltransferase
MKIGLFFGSFNPLHIGHMAIAQYMVEFTDLEQVWFVVSPQNPFKEKSSLLNQHHRLMMVRIATEDNPKLNASDIEFGLSQPSYTVDTLAYIQEKYPKHEFSLIMGSDNLQHFRKWKNSDVILANHQLYVYPRPKTKDCELAKHPKVQITQAPLMEISASFIRQSIHDQKDICYLLPEKVWQYVDEMNFYRK